MYRTPPWGNPQLDLPPMHDFSSEGPAKGKTHPCGGLLTPLWWLVTPVTGESPVPQVPQGSSSSLQGLAKLRGLAGWSGELKSSCFLLLSSSLVQAPSCADSSFHRVRKYERQRNGKLRVHRAPSDSAVGGLNVHEICGWSEFWVLDLEALDITVDIQVALRRFQAE